jgi:phosphoglycolate phosphatase
LQSAISDIRLIVFDLDGTLIDSRRDLANAINALLVECGAEPLAEERVGRMVGDGAATLIARAFEASGTTKPSDALDRFLATYAQHLTDHTKPYAGIAEALTYFQGRATLAVLTNKPMASTRIILDRLDLSRFFAPHLVIGGDGPFARKPDPAGLQWLLERTAAEPSETLLVGDSAIDWRTGRAAGTRVCLARYGFGFEGFPVEQLTPGDFAVESPEGLVRL